MFDHSYTISEDRSERQRMSVSHWSQQATVFVGRDRELGEIAGLLADPTCRLLTLVGPGGIGKTSLALQATSQQPHFEDDVAFVALSPITSPDFLTAAIGAALDIPFFGADDPLFQVINYLRDKHLLLVMDNFEHLLEGVGCLSELLQVAPQLKILATSRERLNLREEWVFPLDGLTYPAAPLADAPESYSAAQLFVQRARQIQHHFVLSEHVDAVLSICRQLEGMPLGLELAASWLHVMSCEQVAARMASNLDFLTTRLRNFPERHRSLRVVFQQSWSLLAADEQAVLMRLSPFHGGFDVEAAAEIAGATLTVLAGLTDKSLLRMDSTGRYDLHELLRQYAGEKLTEAGESDATIQRHITYFMQLAEAGEAHAYGREQAAWYDRQEIEMDNLRAALAWSISHPDVESGLRIAAALRWVWEMRGHLEEGRGWFNKLLPLSTDVSPTVRAKALHRASEIAAQLAHEPQAALWMQEALHLSRSTHDRWNLAWSLSTAAYFTEQDVHRAGEMLEESLALFRDLGDALGLSHTLRRLAGCAVDQQRYDYAADLLAQALLHDRQSGDKSAIAWDLCFMGVVLWTHHHQPDQVIPLYTESITLFGDIKDVRGTAHPLVMLAEAEQAQGNLGQAHAHFQETLLLERGLGIHDNLAILALVGIANLVAANENLDRAARLLGTVHAALESGSYNTRLQALKADFDRTVAGVRSQLAGEAFESAWTAGNSMSLEQAITEALEVKAPPPRAENNNPLLDIISPREFEVLRLLSTGLSNAEIAQQLFISVATVKVHTRSLYGKLNVDNRTQAVIQAHKFNLL
ncbi:MAG: LuxR C-terminal-related transcriptional regulator [Chloroflexota bacterium]